MDERELEAMLEEDLPALPPSDRIVEAVNPWRSSMNRVLWGLGLCTLTLNFANIDAIQTGVGLVLLLLGFRALRKENGWFSAAYAMTWPRLAYYLFTLFANATIYSSEIFASSLVNLIHLAVLFLSFLTMVCLWRGLAAVQAKAGLPSRSTGGWLVLWYTIMLVLGLIGFRSLLVWVMVIAWVCILRGLYKISKALTEAGYAIAPTESILPGWALAGLCAAAAIGCLAWGYLFYSSYEMNWQPVSQTGQADLEDIRQDLLDLGFPETVLNDLTEEELRSCEGAVVVHAETDLADLERYDLHEDGYVPEYDAEITSVAVLLPGETTTWKLFHHVRWLIAPTYRGTESIQLWYDDREDWSPDDGSWASGGQITGRLLYSMDGMTYEADYYRVESGVFHYSDLMLGSGTSTGAVLSCSLPREGDDIRLYFSYTLTSTDPTLPLDSRIHYTHQLWPGIPNIPARDTVNPGIFSYDDEGFAAFEGRIEVWRTGDVRDDLLDLGFPEEVLQDLSSADILACEGALGLYMEERQIVFSGGPADGGPDFTAIALLMPDDRIHVIYHFRWADDVEVPGTVCLRIMPEAEFYPLVQDSLSGRIVYEDRGTGFTQLSEMLYEQGSLWVGFSLPEETDRRCYLSHDIDKNAIRTVTLAARVLYTRQQGAVYPNQTALEWALNGSEPILGEPFQTGFSTFQFEYRDGTLTDHD